ncbi:MAG TPA: hypothetical protein VNX70_08200 [Bryobacteraceae bacterium]|nr:hypothetical protein [Bryobacteraceae bacterium]
MTRLRDTYLFTPFLVALFVCAGTAQAAKISGTISTTMSLTEDSDLVDDVTCTVTGAPCISIDAPQVTLRLNGFTMTGQGDPQTACSGGSTPNEFGILVSTQTGITIRGPGIVQQFRNQGIVLNGSTSGTVTGVTMSTNCFSGVIVIGGSLNVLESNISIRNGNGSNPCGGI